MRKRGRLILCAAGLTAVAVVAVFLVVRPGRADNRFVGSWEGEGTVRANLSLNLGENAGPGGALGGAAALRTSVKATFHRDGTMTMSWRSEGDGIRFNFEVPDPQKPGDVGRWAVVRTDGDAIVVRIIDPGRPDAPEWRVVFRGADEFTATPTDPSKGTDPIVFRRAGR
jgi:hypothetical protein